MILKPLKRLFQLALLLIVVVSGCNRPDSAGELVGTRLNRLKANKHHTVWCLFLEVPIMGQSDE